MTINSTSQRRWIRSGRVILALGQAQRDRNEDGDGGIDVSIERIAGHELGDNRSTIQKTTIPASIGPEPQYHRRRAVHPTDPAQEGLGWRAQKGVLPRLL